MFVHIQHITMELPICVVLLTVHMVGGVLQSAPEPPEFYHGSDTHHIVRPTGATLRMRCAVNSNPPAKVTWQRSGNTVGKKPKLRFRHGSNYNVLIIRDLDPDDSGDYVCQAKNIYGHIRKTYSVSVVDSQQLKPSGIHVEPSTLSLRCGATAEFKCRYLSEIPGHVQWLLEVSNHNNTITNTTNVITVKSKSYEVLSSTAAEDDVLLITNVTARHSGKLVCLVANSFGFAYSGASIHVSPQLGLPTFTKELEDTHVTQDALRFVLECVVRVPAHQGYHVTWSKEGQPIDPEVYTFKEGNNTKHISLCVDEISSSITFRQLVSGHWLGVRDGGMYSCLVHNRSGAVVLYDQATVSIQQPPPVSRLDNEGVDHNASIVSLTPDRVTVHEGSSVTFYCKIKGHSPSVLWLVKHDSTLPVCDFRQTIQINFIPYRLIGSGEMWSRSDGEHLSILRLDNTTMEHTGTYMCYLEQSGKQRETSLTILPGRTGPNVQPPYLGNRTVHVGDTVVLESRVTSDVTPTVRWYKEVHGDEENNDTSTIGGMTVVALGASSVAWERGGAYTSVYKLPEGVQLSDEGRYVCAWTSQWGQDLDQGYLRVTQCM